MKNSADKLTGKTAIATNSLWKQLDEQDSSQISGGKCRWAQGIGLVCETKSGRQIAL